MALSLVMQKTPCFSRFSSLLYFLTLMPRAWCLKWCGKQGRELSLLRPHEQTRTSARVIAGRELQGSQRRAREGSAPSCSSLCACFMLV